MCEVVKASSNTLRPRLSPSLVKPLDPATSLKNAMYLLHYEHTIRKILTMKTTDPNTQALLKL